MCWGLLVQAAPHILCNEYFQIFTSTFLGWILTCSSSAFFEIAACFVYLPLAFPWLPRLAVPRIPRGSTALTQDERHDRHHRDSICKLGEAKRKTSRHRAVTSARLCSVELCLNCACGTTHTYADTDICSAAVLGPVLAGCHTQIHNVPTTGNTTNIRALKRTHLNTWCRSSRGQRVYRTHLTHLTQHGNYRCISYPSKHPTLYTVCTPYQVYRIRISYRMWLASVPWYPYPHTCLLYTSPSPRD